MLMKPAAWATAWSPDGKWIAGTVRLPNTSRETLARVAVGARAKLGAASRLRRESKTSSRNGRPMAAGCCFRFAMQRPAAARVATLALDSTPPKVSIIVDSAGNRIVQLPSLSPDGRGWHTNRTNRVESEVYVQSYPSPAARFQISREGGSRPVWTKRGDAVYFVAGSAIMSSALTTDPEPRFGAPRVIVSNPLLVVAGAGNKWFDVALDGRILAIKEDGSIRTDHIVVVQNWLSEVRARNAEGGQ